MLQYQIVTGFSLLKLYGWSSTPLDSAANRNGSNHVYKELRNVVKFEPNRRKKKKKTTKSQVNGL